MYQCILNVPLWNDWSKVKYSQVHGSLVLKLFLFKSLNWISAKIFAELIQFGQDPKLRRPRSFWLKTLKFHWRKISYFNFTYYTFIYIYIYTYTYIIYIIHILHVFIFYEFYIFIYRYIIYIIRIFIFYELYVHTYINSYIY